MLAHQWAGWVHAIALLALFLGGCAAPRTFEQTVSEFYVTTTSYDAFLRAETRLRKIQPGEVTSVDALGFKYFTIKSAFEGRETDIASADGWIPSMSGGLMGGLYGLGRPYARESDTIYGRHVFGYVWGGPGGPAPRGNILVTTLTPKYVLRTKATLIPKSEYQRLKEQGSKRIGIVQKFREEEDLYFMDLKVHEIRALPFQGIPELPEHEVVIKEVTRAQSRERFLSVYSKKNFEYAKTKLESLSESADWWDVIELLDGFFLTTDYGQGYHLHMNGFANKEKKHRWVKLMPDAIYAVWPFGYTENNREVLILSVIFRNGQFSRVVPYEPQAEMMRHLGE